MYLVDLLSYVFVCLCRDYKSYYVLKVLDVYIIHLGTFQKKPLRKGRVADTIAPEEAFPGVFN